ncbi:hypothetical protein CALVIDRAFT_43384 [Calocera viscosa TUFC12733]|uniref:Uncharacterized protein n=1 Tax=Calocera viscosa (strain TUFC12733) TaxID=1330018 RepID=A0A167P377_CALVF|nr:hypothetical protein CALVIDRAFT_43384 [Calocera viscosa TUFC12733]
MPTLGTDTDDADRFPAELFRGLPAFRPLEFLDFEEARLFAERTRHNLFTLHSGLVRLIQWHGRTIAARLSKRSKEKRKALFHAVNPYLRPTRPRVLEYQSDEKAGGPLQYLNYDDLAAGTHFVSLLATRGLHPVAGWAMFDKEEVSPTSTFFAVNASIRISGQEDDYGLAFQAQGQSMIELQEQMQAVPFGVGMQLLERQMDLLRFLTSVVEELLRDTDLSRPPSNSHPLTLDDIISTDALSLDERTFLRPYTLPPRFSIEWVMQVLLARLSAAADDVWLLRTDPLYFRSRMHQVARSRPPPAGPGKDAFWDDVCRTLVINAYRNLLVWTSAFEEAHAIQVSLIETPNPAANKTRSELSFRMACLECVLEEALTSALAALDQGLQIGKAGLTDIALKRNSVPKHSDITHALAELCQHGTLGSMRGRQYILLAADEVFTRDANQRSKLSMDSIGAISDLYTANSVLMALGYHRPQHSRLNSLQRSSEHGRLLGSISCIEALWAAGDDVPTHDLTRGCQNLDPSRPSSARSEKVAVAMLHSVWHTVDDFFTHGMGTSLLDLTKGSVGFRESKEGTRALDFHEHVSQCPLSFQAPIQADHDMLPFSATLLLSAKKRILNFFAFLFSESEEGEELNWSFEDFKLGMRQLGFRVEHVIASEYRFTPTSDSCFPEFPLSVHQPLPHGHFTRTDRRTLAKRLSQHYGLTRRLFRLSGELHAKLHSVSSSTSVSTDGF